MAEAGPTSELPLEVAGPAAAGPTLEGPLAVLATSFAGPTLEESLSPSAGAEAGVVDRVPSRAHVEPGGMSAELDGGGPTGEHETLSFDTSLGVSIGIAEDAGNTRQDVTVGFSGLRLLASVLNIVLTSTGTTLLYTVPGGTTLLVEAVVLRCGLASGFTAPATVQIEDGSGNPIFQSQLLTGLNEAGKAYLFPQGGVLVEVAAAGTVQVNVVAAATATSLVVEADLIGRTF